MSSEVQEVERESAENTLTPEKYYQKTKKILEKKYTKMNLSKRIRKLQKKIAKIDDLKDEFLKTEKNAKVHSQLYFYEKLANKASKMLDQAYLCRFLSLDLTEEICRLLMCVAEIEYIDSDRPNSESTHLTCKNILLDHVSMNNNIAKKLFNAYNDILFPEKIDDVRVTFTDDEDVCVTFTDNINFPSIGYLT
jgi:hypothetical protein